MHCKSCVAKLTHALRSVDGVTSADVSLNPPRAKVEMSRHVPTETLANAVKLAGEYSLQEFTSEPKSVDEVPAKKESLYPLFLIVAYIAGAVALTGYSTQSVDMSTLMRHFMAGFFLVFSFFKLLDLNGFADAYRTYDVLAGVWPFWALIYPFVELALGIAYLVNFAPYATNIVTLLLMLVGSVGVLKALLKKQSIRCACLGTALNLPMTTITLVEDLGMAAMAAAVLATS